MTFALRPLLLVACATALAGCVTPAPVRMERNPNLPNPPAQATDVAPTPVIVNGKLIDTSVPATTRNAPPPVLKPGNGQLINQRVADAPPPRFAGAGRSTFNRSSSGSAPRNVEASNDIGPVSTPKRITPVLACVASRL